MRKLFIILLFACGTAKGQFTLPSNFGFNKPQSSAVYDYLLDTYTGSSAAYSLRLLKSDYAGAAIRVRESGGDTETDIGFVNNVLDTATLKTFCGSNSGYVVTWYDQSGNGINATESTHGNQPQIVSSGSVIYNNGTVAIYGNGTSSALTFSKSISSNLIYVFSVASRISGGATDGRILGFSNGDSNDWDNTNGWAAITINSSTTQAYQYRNNSFGGTVSTTLGNTYLLYSYLDGSTQGIAINGGSASTASTSSTPVNITKGGILRAPWVSTGGWFNGYIHELIIWEADESSNRAGIESNINSFYTIY